MIVETLVGLAFLAVMIQIHIWMHRLNKRVRAWADRKLEEIGR